MQKQFSMNETKDLMQQTLKRYFGDVLSDKMLKDEKELDMLNGS